MNPTQKLGNADLDITRIGYGSWAIGGGDWRYGWGDQDDADSIAAVHAAISGGVNWIDTAAVYGLGHSEEIVSKAIHGMSQRPYIFTKCSMTWGAEGKDPKEIVQTMKKIRTECEASLKRLGVEAIDLYQIHWPVPDDEIEEGWQTMADLQREGKVRYIGVSNFSVAQLKRALAIAPVTSQQPPYSAINRTYDPENFNFCREHSIGIINYSPMHSGLLTGAMTKERVAALPENDFRRNAKNYTEPFLSRNLALAELMKRIGAKHGVTAGVIAIAWTLRNPAVTGAIVGGRSPRQVQETLPALTFVLPDEDYTAINTHLAEHFA